VFESLLNASDASRATAVVECILGHGLPCALTGGLAIGAQLRARGCSVGAGKLNDVDLVVPGMSSIPESLAADFLQNHVHATAPEGKTLIQLVDPRHKVRVDLFRVFGSTLSRVERLDAETGALDVLGIEDLVARTTAHVCMSLRRGLTIDVKHVRAFELLQGIGQYEKLAEAWSDHHQDVPGTIDEASQEAVRLLIKRPDLVIVEEYGASAMPCDRCSEYGAFKPAPSELIGDILGYS